MNIQVLIRRIALINQSIDKSIVMHKRCSTVNENGTQ